MAIKIPILTSFDPKGLKQANAAFAGLQTSMGSLGRNFAVVGAGIVAGTALLGQAVMSASNFEAEFEGVNQVFKEAAGSVQAFAESAAQTAGLSATEALRASKTFGLFATGVGLGVKEAANFSTTLVQLAGDLGSFNDLPTADALAAIQSGLQGQAEPLRNFGVFLDDLTLKQSLFNVTGEKVTGTLTTQQKMIAAYASILEQTTIQQGDFVKYQETLGNQLKNVSADFDNLVRDIGMMLIPAITAAMPQIKEMAAVIGTELKEAISSIDWKGTIQAVVDFTKFLVNNAQSIITFAAGIFILNTAFKLMSVVSGLVSTAIALQTWLTAQLASGMTIATVATTLLNAAMRLIPFVAIATGIALVVTGIMQLGDESKNNTPYVDNYGGAIRKSGADAEWAAKRYGIAAQAASVYNTAVGGRSNGPRGVGRTTSVMTPAAPDMSWLTSLLNSGGGGGGGSSRAAAAKAAAEAAAAAEQAILDKRKSAFESFNESVKSIFGQIKDSIMSSFTLPTLGNSVNSITRNISKLLEKTRSFAKNIAELSGLGLNSTLLQQVIQAGPMAGSQLASALVGGGSGFIQQLNSAYDEFGNLAGGIAGIGTERAFANQGTVNNYSIEVTGGVATSADVGRAVVNAIKDFERQSGTAWRG
jgi:hypothetical protein